MKKLLPFFLFVLPSFSFSQPIIQWQKTYGGTAVDEASVIRATSDGGYIITGLSTSADGDVSGHQGASDHWVVKLNAVGNIEWNNSFGGSADDKGYDILQTSDGGYVFTGYESSVDGDVSSNNGSTDYWVVKLDNTGDLQWQKSYGGSGADNSYAIIQTLDGGYAVTGLSNTTNGTGDVSGNNGSFDYWLCKLDASGNLQWQKSLGGTATEQAFGIVQTADSSYVLCGYSSSPNTGMVTGNHGSNDYWIVKIDKTGELLWQRSYGGSGSDRAFGISKTSDGGFIVNGVSPSTDGDVTSNHGDNDYWVVKLDSEGLLQWQKSLGGSGDDFGRIAFELTDGGYMVGGRTNSPNDGDVKDIHGDYDYWLLKLNSTGSIVWKKCLGGSLGEGAPPSLVPFMNVIALPDGYFAMAGATFSTDGDVIGNVSADVNDDNYWVVNFIDSSSIPTSAATLNNGIENTITIYPVPVHDLLTVSFSSQQSQIVVSLYSIEGRLLLTATQHESQNMELAVGNYSNGIYFLKITDEKGNVQQKKIIRN